MIMVRTEKIQQIKKIIDFQEIEYENKCLKYGNNICKGEYTKDVVKDCESKIIENLTKLKNFTFCELIWGYNYFFSQMYVARVNNDITFSSFGKFYQKEKDINFVLVINKKFPDNSILNQKNKKKILEQLKPYKHGLEILSMILNLEIDKIELDYSLSFSLNKLRHTRNDIEKLSYSYTDHRSPFFFSNGLKEIHDRLSTSDENLLLEISDYFKISDKLVRRLIKYTGTNKEEYKIFRDIEKIYSGISDVANLCNNDINDLLKIIPN